MKKVSTYQASDGKLFTDKKECQAHEVFLLGDKLDEGTFEEMVLEILNQ